jgi:signal transduction histidine kinase
MSLAHGGGSSTADGVRFDGRVTGFTRPIAPDSEVDLRRFGHEAITNAVRHGQPSRLEVRLECAGPAT